MRGPCGNMLAHAAQSPSPPPAERQLAALPLVLRRGRRPPGHVVRAIRPTTPSRSFRADPDDHEPGVTPARTPAFNASNDASLHRAGRAELGRHTHRVPSTRRLPCCGDLGGALSRLPPEPGRYPQEDRDRLPSNRRPAVVGPGGLHAEHRRGNTAARCRGTSRSTIPASTARATRMASASCRSSPGRSSTTWSWFPASCIPSGR